MIAELKVAVLKTFGTQIVGARRMKINEGRLSYLIQGHDEPTERERKLLEKWLGRDYFAEAPDQVTELKPETAQWEGGGQRHNSLFQRLTNEAGTATIYSGPKKDPAES